MAYIRKSCRATQSGAAHFAAAIALANSAFSLPQYEDRPDGSRVRVWRTGEMPSREDGRQWLIGNRVVELDEGLEFLTKGYIASMVKNDHLRRDARGSFYWVTAKAATYFELPPVLGCEFPK